MAVTFQSLFICHFISYELLTKNNTGGWPSLFADFLSANLLIHNGKIALWVSFCIRICPFYKRIQYSRSMSVSSTNYKGICSFVTSDVCIIVLHPNSVTVILPWGVLLIFDLWVGVNFIENHLRKFRVVDLTVLKSNNNNKKNYLLIFAFV